MPNYSVNPVLHNQGGNNTPYEKYHLTETDWERATRTADFTRDGLAPANIMANLNYVSPPHESSSSGDVGDRALDGSYFYLCIAADTWRRIPINSF